MSVTSQNNHRGELQLTKWELQPDTIAIFKNKYIAVIPNKHSYNNQNILNDVKFVNKSLHDQYVLPINMLFK